jgi:RNA polymerase sigma factor (sigma-70 family)
MKRNPARETEETLLVRRCAEGEDAAWEELLHRYGAFLNYMIRRALVACRGGRVPSVDEVEEIRDEIVAWLLANEGRVLKTYRGESRLTSWLGVVVGRRARRLARRGAGLRERTVSLDSLTPEATSHLALDPREDQTPRQLALAQLTDAIERLSERDRLLLRGAFYEKRSYAELAQELGVRTDSIGQLLYRAKSRLKKHLGGTGFLESLSGTLLAGLIWLLRGTAT